MTRKSFFLSLICTIFFVLSPKISYAQSAGLFLENPSTSPVEIGKPQVLNVILDTAQIPVSGISTKILFPANSIQVSSINPTKTFSTVLNNSYDTAQGRISLELVAMANTASLPKGKNIIAEIHYIPQKSTNNSLDFSFEPNSQIVGTQSNMPVVFAVNASPLSVPLSHGNAGSFSGENLIDLLLRLLGFKK